MDVVVLHGSLDQSLSPYKSNYRNPRKIPNSLISWPSDSFLASQFHSYGLLQTPPMFPSQSLPPFSQPPLLPLPAANPRRSAATYPPARKASNGSRKRESLKSKSPKKEGRNSPKKPSNGNLGPDQKVLPLMSSSSGVVINSNENKCIRRYNSLSSPAVEVEKFSGSAVFAISPPPSSLPLPTFSLRPKLSCKAEVTAGIDAGATDDLRRLLRLC